MALTRYRLPASGAAPASPALQSYTHNAPATLRSPLPTSDSTALATTAYTPDAADHGTAGDSLHRQFVSAALTAGTVFSVGNTIKLSVQGLEAHANNNLNLQLWVGVYSSSHALQQTLLGKAEHATEFTTSLVNRFLSTTVANAYTTVTGDYLVAEISVEGTPGGGGGVQGHNASLRWGSDGASGDLPENDTETGTTFNPWFEIQEDEPAVTGDLAATSPASIAAVSGTVAWVGTFAATSPASVAEGDGTVEWAATLAATSPTSVAAFSGEVELSEVTGDLDAVSPVSVFAAAGSVFWSATLAASSPASVAAMDGEVSGEGGTEEFICAVSENRRRQLRNINKKRYR